MLIEEPEKEDGKPLLGGSILSPMQLPDIKQDQVVYPSKNGLTKDYSVEDLLDVWRLSFHAGMIAELVIENNMAEGERTQAMDKIMVSIFAKINNHLTLKEVLTNRMILLGLIAEALELKEIR